MAGWNVMEQARQMPGGAGWSRPALRGVDPAEPAPRGGGPSGPLPAGGDPARPAPARIYDYLLRGENNFPSDRAAAARLTAVVPALREGARADRRCHQP